MKNKKIDRVILTGPTGAGKSDFALDVCCRFPETFEIISADSVQIYRGLDIGSGKVSPEERRGVVHHLVDIAEPDEHFDVSRFCYLADRAEEEIRSRGRIPLFVGGTILYIRSYCDGISPMPESDKTLRQQLADEGESYGSPVLHRQLEQLDPQSAQRIHPNDLQRIIRAIEVCKVSGSTMTELRNKREGRMSEQTQMYALMLPRQELYEKINQRFDCMILQGFIEEVQLLRQKGYTRNAPALQSLGYRQIMEYLDGLSSPEEAIETAKRMTRRYAKKQMTWIRGYDRCISVDYNKRDYITACIGDSLGGNYER